MDHEELVALAKQTREKRLEYKKGLDDIKINAAETAKEKRDAIVRDMKARLSMNADTVKGQIAQLTYERNLTLKNERLTQNEVLALKQKFNEDVAKIEADDRAERFAKYKAYRDNRTSAERKIQDIELELALIG
jgi:predicted nuclease with TOPRIM domain